MQIGVGAARPAAGALEHGAFAAAKAAVVGEQVIYQIVPTAPPLDPIEVDSSESAGEVVIMWGELSALHVAHLSPPRSFYVGAATDVKGKSTTDFLIGSESIGADRMPIAAESGAGVAAVIPHGAGVCRAEAGVAGPRGCRGGDVQSGRDAWRNSWVHKVKVLKR